MTDRLDELAEFAGRFEDASKLRDSAFAEEQEQRIAFFAQVDTLLNPLVLSLGSKVRRLRRADQTHEFFPWRGIRIAGNEEPKLDDRVAFEAFEAKALYLTVGGYVGVVRKGTSNGGACAWEGTSIILSVQEVAKLPWVKIDAVTEHLATELVAQLEGVQGITTRAQLAAEKLRRVSELLREGMKG